MVTFDTKDSMGANFINSVLESFASTLESFIIAHPSLPDEAKDLDIIMSICQIIRHNAWSKRKFHVRLKT